MANRLLDFDAVLLDLCRASLCNPDEGPSTPACAQLIRDVIALGREQFVQRHTRCPGPNEYRLNGAGLKLCYEVESFRDGEDSHVYVTNLGIDGDGVKEYPKFVRAAQPILQVANARASACRVIRVAG